MKIYLEALDYIQSKITETIKIIELFKSNLYLEELSLNSDGLFGV